MKTVSMLPPKKTMKCAVEIPDGITLRNLNQYISDFNIPPDAKLCLFLTGNIRFEWIVEKP